MVMARRSLLKDLFRSLTNTKARFLSIMAIIALGVGFFSGINATEPDMILSADQYYQTQRLSDFRLISPLGFQAADIEAVRTLSGVGAVQAGYSKDLFLTTAGGNTATVKIYSYDAADYQSGDGLNVPTVIEGRLPEQAGEIAVDASRSLPDELGIGSAVTLSVPDGEQLTDFLKTGTYTIVGLIDSPLYITYERGQTNIGDGSISFFGLIGEADFTMDRVTDLFIRTSASASLTAYSDAYAVHLAPIKQALDNLGKDSVALATADLRRQLDEGKAKLQDKKAQVEQELADGEAKLLAAEQELTDGEAQLQEKETTYTNRLDEQRQALAKGRSQLEAGKSQYADQYALWLEGYKTWQAGSDKLASSKSQLDDAGGQIARGESELAAAKAQLDQAKPQLDDLERSLDALRLIRAALPAAAPAMTVSEYLALIEQIRLYAPELAVWIGSQNGYGDVNLPDLLTGALDQTLTQMEKTYADGLRTYEDGLARYQQGAALMAANKLDYEQGLADYTAGQAELDLAKAQLDSGKTALDQAKATLDASEARISRGEAALAKGAADLQQSLDQGRQKIAEGRQQLADARAEYEQKKTDALEQIAGAETEIRQAEQQLVALPDNWFVLTRDENPGYSGYGDDAGRIGAVAKVFPLFFFLVAALVCLTTMTRMVEEERSQIGTLKALGYGAWTIAAKYLVYALLASLIGSLTGLAVGFRLFPILIMNAYGMMYGIPDRLTPFHLNYAALSILLAVATTVSVTLAATLQELRVTPAILMQPKAPKPGKRIFLERIKPFWKKLSFSRKVTARNLFRYKKRLLMTVIGIAGCTALLVSGFGLKDSVNAIMDNQFTKIFIYDAQVVIDPEQAGSLDNLTGYLSGQTAVAAYLPEMAETVTALAAGSGRTYEANMLVPADSESFKLFYDLHERRSGAKLDLPADGAVISEKLAALLQVGVGDTFQMRDSANRTYKVRVAGVAEQYLTHYIYLSPAYFDQLTFRTPLYNIVAVNVQDPNAFDEQAFKENTMAVDGVLGTLFARDFADSLKDTMESLDYVVLILIITAGALAFVVLYNLTNINITERVREIATIKVLGFRDNEVSAYVYRENTILTLIGTGIGLLLGLLLHRFVIGTMEVDTMMFGKTVSWLSFLLSIALTIAFAALVNFFMYYKLRKVNMVASLKSVE